MFKQKLTYWLPRLFVISFAISLVLPAPGFIAHMEKSQLVIWWARLLWVIGLPIVFCLLCMVVAFIGKRRAKRSR